MSTVVKKVKIGLEYNGNTINIELGPYKTIKELKEKATQLFYLKYEVILFGNNKDLAPYENWTIGEFFKNKPSVSVKVQQKLNQFSKELNASMSLVASGSSTIIGKDENPNNQSTIAVRNVSGFVTCECLTDSVSYYCRNCWVFICNSCRKNKTHKNHSQLFVDMAHIDESLKQYCKIILTDIDNNTKSFQHNYNYFQNKNMLDHQARKEMIIRKLDELEKKQEEIVKQIPNIDESLKYFEIEKQALEEKQDLEKIIETTHKTKPGFVKASEIFHEVNNKEKEVREINRKVRCFKVFCEIHEKIDENYKEIERLLDQIEGFDYHSIIKKAEDQNQEDEGFGKEKDTDRKTKDRAYRLEIKNTSILGEYENVLKDYKKFNILQNGNFNFDFGDGKDIIKGKFIGDKVTMQKLGKENSIFFEGLVEENKLKFTYDSDSSNVSELMEKKEFKLEVTFKLDKYTLNFDGNNVGLIYLNKGDELDNKLIRNGFTFKDNKAYLILCDLTSKNFCRVSFWNTEGSNELTGTSFNINEGEKIIDIKP